jgi:ABC-type Fe3+-hydroxamate transport system substrate-binding protein
MKIPHLFFILVLVVSVVICGCTQPLSDNRTKPAADTPSTPMTTVTTVLSTSMSTPVIPKDPIVGSWYCIVYPLWGGKVVNEFTLMENQTWDRVITEYQDEVEKEYAHGTWKKESTNHYLLTSSITHVSHTFEYDNTKDELLDTDFKLLYHRVA